MYRNESEVKTKSDRIWREPSSPIVILFLSYLANYIEFECEFSFEQVRIRIWIIFFTESDS